jgi:hypothetical protein
MDKLEYHKLFMTNAMCCYGKKAACIAKNLQIGKKVTAKETFQLKLLFLFIKRFKVYNTDCITEADYEKIYQAITNICKFCNCNKTIVS